MMARPNLTLEEAEDFAHFGIPVVPDVMLLARWLLNVDRLPVKPVPEAGSRLFACAVVLYRARVSTEALQDSLYAPNNRLGRPTRRRPR
ncbi:hypothetical protein ZWY2020_017390 [Hordeum vulgare]|nr:hypothetical protein ZWY2020_017390 [Hordeum vulgare]